MITSKFKRSGSVKLKAKKSQGAKKQKKSLFFKLGRP